MNTSDDGTGVICELRIYDASTVSTLFYYLAPYFDGYVHFQKSEDVQLEGD